MNRLLTALLVLTSCLGAAQSTDGRKSGIADADLARIRATHLRWLLPTAVPKGFKVSRVELHREKNPVLTYLNITYKRGSATMALQQCSEGIGDVMFDEEPDSKATSGLTKFNLPTISRKNIEMEYQRSKGVQQWHVNWIELPGKSYPRFLCLYGERCERREGVDLFKSLRYLR